MTIHALNQSCLFYIWPDHLSKQARVFHFVKMEWVGYRAKIQFISFESESTTNFYKRLSVYMASLHHVMQNCTSAVWVQKSKRGRIWQTPLWWVLKEMSRKPTRWCLKIAKIGTESKVQEIIDTVYPKKYAHGFCFAVLCCGYPLTDFPISIRLTSLALWQSNDCPSASKATLMNMDKNFMWIHYERLHNHNKAKHNKTVCIFPGTYCTVHVVECEHLSMSKLCARGLPKILTPKMKNIRDMINTTLLTNYNADPDIFCIRFFIGDGACIHYHKPESSFEFTKMKHGDSRRRKCSRSHTTQRNFW